MPRRGQRTSLRLAVSNHDADDQIRIVERSAEGMRNALTQLSALMNRYRQFRRAMASELAWKGKARNSFSIPASSRLFSG